MSRRPAHPSVRTVLGAAIVVVLALVVSAPALDPAEYGALATAIQAVIVTVALAVALITHQGDSRDRRVDRVLALHREFFDPAFQAERRVLVSNLRAIAEQPAELSVASLSHDEYLTRIKILRYFERAQSTNASGSLDDRLAASLLGSHAAWWDLAMAMDDKTSRQPVTLASFLGQRLRSRTQRG